MSYLGFFVNPVVLSLLVRDDFSFAKPKINLLFRAFDGVGSVADIAAHILLSLIRGLTISIFSKASYNSIVAPDGTWSRL